MSVRARWGTGYGPCRPRRTRRDLDRGTQRGRQAAPGERPATHGATSPRTSDRSRAGRGQPGRVDAREPRRVRRHQRRTAQGRRAGAAWPSDESQEGPAADGCRIGRGLRSSENWCTGTGSPPALGPAGRSSPGSTPTTAGGSTRASATACPSSGNSDTVEPRPRKPGDRSTGRASSSDSLNRLP